MTETTTSEARSDESAAKDPGQLVPSTVDTAPELLGPLTWADMKSQAPAALVIAIGAYGFVSGAVPLFLGGLVLGVGLSIAAFWVRLTDEWFTSPRDRFDAWAGYLHRKRNADVYERDILPDVTGVEGVSEEGFIEMDDGRHVALIRIDPRNTAMLDERGRNRLAAALSDVIDEQIRDMPFRLFSTSRATDVDDVADRYEERALGPETPDGQADVLLDVADWLTDADAPTWDARDWRHYFVVDAGADDVRTADASFRSMLNPLADTESVSDDQVRAVLGERVERATDAISTVSGLSGRPVAPEEAIDVVRTRWGRGGSGDGLPDRLVDEVVAGNADAHRVTAPETWEPRRGWIALGGVYARTMWLSEYPTEPESLWLKRLCTLRGVDVDVTINAEPEASEDAVYEVSKKVADVGAEGAERAEEGDVSAMDTDSANEANTKLRELFDKTPSQPWQMSTYVTVRADDRAALETAGDAMATFDDVDGAKMGALEDATEAAVDALDQSPANTTPVAPGVTQGAAFRAASPLTWDVWDEETNAPKRRRVPGAVIGAAFPPAAASWRESGGMDWGRNEENGTHFRLSPFNRGGAPHMLTIGQSRSGKTYSGSKAALRWYLERDDRTLIVCDTQKGFDGLTQLCGGEHIVVDGDQSVNPLRIEPSDAQDADGTDEFRMTVDETVGFLVGLLRADDVANAGEYAPLLAQAAERTLAEAGIKPSDPGTFEQESPTLDDLLATLVDMNDNPAEYTWSDAGHEVESHKRQVGDLLTKLRSFQAEGKYANLVGEDELGVIDEDVSMAYLDLHALADSGDAEKSAMLQLMLSQVREKIKRTPGEVIFAVDEAHVLLDNERTVDWLQRAAREFARYDACLWFLSQSPKDFVAGADESAAKDTIRAQCSTIHFFRTPRVDPAVLEKFGLNETQREFVREKAVRGKAGRGYSECLIDAEDIEGWVPCYVESSPLEDRVLTYSRLDHGGVGDRREDFRAYMAGADEEEVPAP